MPLRDSLRVEEAAASAAGTRGVSGRSWAALVVGVSSIAFLARLLPLLRGGGLFGFGNYDDGVYFAASIGFVHGLMPYRDFLLLHPPGIVLALAPFAALGRLVGDPTAFAAARIGWMVLGTANAVLVARILRPLGMRAAAFGALFYAIFYPAVYSDHTTELETLGTTLTLLALAVLAVPKRHPWWLVSLGGAMLGAAAGVKIWGALPVLVVAVWLAVSADVRRGVRVLLGGLVGATLVCLPFFVLAPRAMWRMVVLDQVGRPETTVGLGTRLLAILGQNAHSINSIDPIVIAATLAFTVASSYAFAIPKARLALVVFLASFVLLMLTPSWFPHYASLVAGPAAVMIGAGLGSLVDRAQARGSRAGSIATVATFAVLAGYGLPVTQTAPGRSFPGRTLAASAAATPGCISADEPTTLIELNVLGRNVDRGCQLVVDLGGWTYDNPPPRPMPRAQYKAFQDYALGYLRTAGATIVTRFTAGSGFSVATMNVIDSWPVIGQAGQFVLRRPAGSPNP